MKSDSSDEHHSNADFPNLVSLQTVANANFESFLQALKQDLEIVSTDEGRQIDSSDQQ
jgi:hypothetical protein